MKKILVMNFFPAFFPPSSGGELRYFHLYDNLSRYYDITLLSPTFSHKRQEVVEHSSAFREYRVPKEAIHDYLHMEIGREQIGPEISALVCALSAKYPNAYHDIYLQLYPGADIIIHDCPYMLEYDFFFGFDDKPRVYNSYNYESSLMDQIWSGLNARKYKDYIYDLERRLVAGSDLVFATGKDEATVFIQEFGIKKEKVKLAPNGINPDDLSYDRRRGTAERARAVFIGSAHPPNVEAVDFIVHELSDKCPGIDFFIAGTCADTFSHLQKANVHLLGRIDEKKKQELLARADIAINPMFSGSGTNLKTLEFLSTGLPLFSTRVGVRGLDVTDREHFILAEGDDFAAALNELTGDTEGLELLGKRGRRHVNENYSWEKISGNVRSALESLTTSTAKKKRILLLNDFEASNPTSGGEVRINRIYAHLSAYYRFLLVCFNDEGIIRRSEITDAFVELSFPKAAEHIQEEHKTHSEFWVSVRDIVTSYMCKHNALLVKTVEVAERSVGAVIFIHPYMAPLLAVIKNANVVYESLNCELALKSSILVGHPRYSETIGQVEKVERMVCERSGLVVSVSDDDHACLARLAPPGTEIVTVKNGVEITDETLSAGHTPLKDVFRGHPVIVFIGSAHRPNVDALNFIVTTLAPTLPQCYFAVIGTVCSARGGPHPSNVLFFDRMEEEHKNLLLRVCDVAINPMFSGSGSNLKLAEFFANGLPVVTTQIGARGYEIANYREAVICEGHEFPGKVMEVLMNKNLQESLSQNGFSYAKRNVDWRILARRYYAVLQRRFFGGEKKRLLIVTYRFTDPPLGGAEVFLWNLIRQLGELDDFFIDVATLDIHEIVNKFHFSIEFTRSSDPAVFSFGKNTSIRKFKAEEAAEASKYECARELFRIWMKEFVESSLRYVDRYDEPLLMGGWHSPEKVGGRMEIWSSGESLIYLDGAGEVTISGLSLRNLSLKIYADGNLVFHQEVNDRFEIKLKLTGPKVLKLAVAEFCFDYTDPRPLGIRICRITLRKGDNSEDLRLDRNYRDFLIERYREEFIEEMIRVAQSRDHSVDDLFQSLRGPNSREMEEWLDENVKDYDIVLGHSVPFQTTLFAVKYAKKYDKPVVLLPHYHFDDLFYHWSSYYAALKEADRVIASPNISIPLFYEHIGAKTCHLAGGGVLKREFENVDISPFRSLYGSERPFVLVLGRKSGGKNYEAVIDAVRRLNRRGENCKVVLIGKDEDGRQIDAKEALYLSEQSREVVLGALSECLCVVNMSESESFGIVILEAWMMKKPVIVSENCSAFLELVQDTEDGLFANKENLSEKIAYVLRNPAEAERMGGNGYHKVSEFYTWESIGKEINRLLLGTLGDREQGGVCRKADTPVNDHPFAPDDEITKIRDQFSGGVPHEEDFLFFRNLEDGDGLFLDIGANAGQSAVSFRCMSKRRHIISFEPNRLFEPVLRYVKERLLKRFDYYMVGLGETKGVVELILPYVDGKPYFQECSVDAGQFEKPWVLERLKSYGDNLQFKHIEIAIETLDSFGLSPEIVKIDAEGFELAVLAGMEKTIESCLPIFLIENNDYQRVTDFLKEYGYEVFAYDAAQNNLRPPRATTNCFYLHRSRHAVLVKKYFVA